MIFKAHELDKNLEKFNFFLLHGVNEGHKEEIINKFKELYEENIFKYYEKEIFSNINVFYDQILSKSFFENKKLIIIKEATDKLKNEIEILKEKKLSDIKIICVSNILDKKSKLRNFLKKKKYFTTVAFYAYQSNTSVITKKFFNEKNSYITRINKSYCK